MSSIWSDVRSDAAATDELVRQLLAAAGAVGEVVAILEGDGPIGPDDWGGPHRTAYDHDLVRLRTSARRVAEHLVATAAVATARSAAAEAEQRLRVRLRLEAIAAGASAPGRPPR